MCSTHKGTGTAQSERTGTQTPRHSLPMGTSGVTAQYDPGLCALAATPQHQQGLPFRAILTRQIVAFLQTLSHLLPTTSEGRNIHIFQKRKIELREGAVTCPRPHSESVSGLDSSSVSPSLLSDSACQAQMPSFFPSTEVAGSPQIRIKLNGTPNEPP